MSTTFEQLVEDLTRDYQRAQPKDALQFSTSWFQSRLEEQRARLRAAVASSKPSGVPVELYQDAYPGGGGASYALGGSRLSPRPSLTDVPVLKNPFGPQSALSAFSPGSGSGAGGGPFVTINEDEALSPTAFSNPFGSPPTHPSALPLDPRQSFGFHRGSVSGPVITGDNLGPPPSSLGRRTSVSAESIIPSSNSSTPLPFHPKTAQQLSRIKAAIKNNFIFRDVEDKQLNTVLGAMEEVTVKENEVVIRQGDEGDYFYVVEEGLLLCYVKEVAEEGAPISGMFANTSPFGTDPLSSPSNGSTNHTLIPVAELRQSTYHPYFGKRVAECGPGSSFGELALMYGHQRAATVLAVANSTLWRLDRMSFRTIILKAAHLRRTMYEDFLSGVSLLKELSREERSKIADALVSMTVEDGKEVIREGDVGDTFFFVEEGEALVSKKRKDGGEGEEQLSTLTKGDYFGELSLIREEPRAATIRAKPRTDPSQPKLKVAQMKAAAFTRLLGPMREIMERKAEGAYGITPKA